MNASSREVVGSMPRYKKKKSAHSHFFFCSGAVLRAIRHSPWSLVVFFFALTKGLSLQQKAVVFFFHLPACLQFVGPAAAGLKETGAKWPSTGPLPRLERDRSKVDHWTTTQPGSELVPVSRRRTPSYSPFSLVLGRHFLSLSRKG